MLYATQVSESSSLDIIDMKFMERGHSFLEVDSMHATTKRAKKHQKLYSTMNWAILVTGAHKKNPYNVTQMTFKDFSDLKQLAKKSWFDIFT